MQLFTDWQICDPIRVSKRPPATVRGVSRAEKAKIEICESDQWVAESHSANFRLDPEALELAPTEGDARLQLLQTDGRIAGRSLDIDASYQAAPGNRIGRRRVLVGIDLKPELRVAALVKVVIADQDIVEPCRDIAT